jgi:hypothetical protein
MPLVRFGERDPRLGYRVVQGDGQAFIPAVAFADSGGGTAVAASSGNVANASAAATLAAPGAGLTNYLTGFSITFSGATAASVVTATVTGLLGGTLSFTVAVPAGATIGGTPLLVDLAVPHPASAANVAIVVTLPALGAGNTNAAVTVRGIVK